MIMLRDVVAPGLRWHLFRFVGCSWPLQEVIMPRDDVAPGRRWHLDFASFRAVVFGCLCLLEPGDLASACGSFLFISLRALEQFSCLSLPATCLFLFCGLSSGRFGCPCLHESGDFGFGLWLIFQCELCVVRFSRREYRTIGTTT